MRAAALWRVLPTDYPDGPVGAAEGGDVVTLNRGRGFQVLESLRAAGHRVGPVAVCLFHEVVHIPVTRWNPLLASRGVVVRPDDLSCADSALLPRSYHGQMWLLPPDPDHEAHVTESAAVFDAIHAARCGT
jgi:hypothetical protein